MLATRTKAGVLAFGTDADMRSAFDAYGITDFDLHPIETRSACDMTPVTAACCAPPSPEPSRGNWA